MKPETMLIWERGVGDSRLWGTLEYMSAIVEMDAYRKDLERQLCAMREAIEWAIDNVDWDDAAVLKEMTGIGVLDNDEKAYLDRRRAGTDAALKGGKG